MTVINNIEIDNIVYKNNVTKDAINNNCPIENKLHVIAVISNPCMYATRYILMREFIKRMELDEKDVILYIVELTYKNQKFIITDANNKKHLQLRVDVPLWHKENMINLGVRYLLPKNWKAFAWIDADLEFESCSWAMDTLKILNGAKDIVQLFSHCEDMDKNGIPMSVFNSFGYQYCREKPYCRAGINFWHPGFAWACTRKAYEKMGGLFDYGILGSGDHIMAMSLIHNSKKTFSEKYSENYKKCVLNFENKISGLRLGYVPGVIKHHFHGSKKNRKYSERWEILTNNNYDPITDIKYDKYGVIIPSENFSLKFQQDIMQYFSERNEDEGRK
jgi:hypothetical protein